MTGACNREFAREAPSPCERRKQLDHDCGGDIRFGARQRSRALQRDDGEHEEVALSHVAFAVHRQGLHVITRWESDHAGSLSELAARLS